MVSGHHGHRVAQCPLRCVATGARPGKYTLIINMRYLLSAMLPRCRHYTGRCVLPSVRLLAAVTALLLQLPRHVPVQGGGLVTVDTVLAGWRHGTKRGRGPRWLIELIISYFNLTLLVVSLPPCPPSPARRPGTARGGSCNSRPHSGRLASWYETGVGGPTVIHSITYKQPDHTLMMVSSCPCPPSPARRLGTTKGELCYSSPHSGRLAPWHETGAWAPLVDSITYKQPHHTLIVVSSPAR